MIIEVCKDFYGERVSSKPMNRLKSPVNKGLLHISSGGRGNANHEKLLSAQSL